MYYMGIDGGGTKSRLLVTDEQRNIIARYEGLETNIYASTKEQVKQNISALTKKYLDEYHTTYSECISICIGSAGIDTAESVGLMETILNELGFCCPITVVNDAQIILWSEMKHDPGIILISGTGSIAYGKNEDGEVLRSGGWGHLFDDEGSGYWIGQQILKRAFQAYDGRAEETLLCSYLNEWFHTSSLDQIIPQIYSRSSAKKNIAALSILAIRGLEENDRVAKEILTEAAFGLFTIVVSLYQRLQLERLESKLILSGGNLLNNLYLQQQLKHLIYQKYNNVSVIQTQHEAVMGAVYLAHEHNKKRLS